MIHEYSRTELLLGEKGLKKLRNASVMVFGVGGVGSHCIEALARSGVGKLILIDNDTVSLTNINRQSIAYHSTVGKYKTKVMEERIRDICPEIQVVTHELFVLPNNLETLFIDALEYDEYGKPCLLSKEFSKKLKEVIKPLTDWLKTEDALERFNYGSKNEVWMKYCFGTKAKWEMDSLSYYSDEHELDEIDISKFYDIENFKELPEEPATYMFENEKSRRRYKRFKLSIIAGTVVDKDKTKNMVTLNTQFGVVQIKLYKESFTKYDRKTPEEPSWFTRGNKLVVVGYRRGETFVPRIYPESRFTSSIMKIQFNKQGNIEIASERLSDAIESFVDYI